MLGKSFFLAHYQLSTVIQSLSVSGGNGGGSQIHHHSHSATCHSTTNIISAHPTVFEAKPSQKAKNKTTIPMSINSIYVSFKPLPKLYTYLL
jgi:hypothetical protein